MQLISSVVLGVSAVLIVTRSPIVHGASRKIPLLPAKCGHAERQVYGHNILPDSCKPPTQTPCGFGGKPAQKGKWPWMVVFGDTERTDPRGRSPLWFCGGTLITDRHVLTAAHCLPTAADLATIVARLGEHDLSTEWDVHHQDRSIRRVTRHPDRRRLQNDIALVELRRPYQPSATIEPICLPRAGSEHHGRHVEMAGFGYLETLGELPDVLQEVPLRVSDEHQCERAYMTRRLFDQKYPGGFQGTKVCASSRDTTPRDACPGDSGGPLMARISGESGGSSSGSGGRYELVGVVAAGIGCGDPRFPGIYTKVSAYVDWILRNL